jgi:hypothetical protein
VVIRLETYDAGRLSGGVTVSDVGRARRILDLLDEPGRIVWLLDDRTFQQLSKQKKRTQPRTLKSKS